MSRYIFEENGDYFELDMHSARYPYEVVADTSKWDARTWAVVTNCYNSERATIAYMLAGGISLEDIASNLGFDLEVLANATA